MIAKGTYRAMPVGAALGKTGTGKEQIAIMFELADESGQRIPWYGYFTDATFDRTIESLRHLGWQGADLGDFAQGLPESVNQEVEIVIDHEADQEGVERARVRWINSGRGIAVKERLDDQAARSFGARMRSRVAALQASKGQNGASRTTAQKSTPAVAMPGEDEVPF
jgi:hypothetical protein